ncbi:MAG: trypsin-like serine protease [Pseudomonadota bacterium]
MKQIFLSVPVSMVCLVASLLVPLRDATALPAPDDPLVADSRVFRGIPAESSRALKGERRIAPEVQGALIELPPPTASESKRPLRTLKEGPQAWRIGFGRKLPSPYREAISAQTLDWQENVGGGRVAALRFRSPGALGLRVALQVTALPVTAELRYFSPSGQDSHIYRDTGVQVQDTLQRNRASGDAPEADGLYWSPMIEGDSLGLEIHLPPGVDPAGVQMGSPMLSHVDGSQSLAPGRKFRDLIGHFQSGGSLPCEVDMACYMTDWGTVANGVGHMVFTGTTGGTYACTGSLIADQDPNGQIPYFLTANHCFSGQATASTLQTWWFYRPAECDGPPPGSLNTFPVLTHGATLLAAMKDKDTTLAKLNDTPPAGAVAVGWDASPPVAGSTVVGIHHPSGDLQKISIGHLREWYLSCINDDDNWSNAGVFNNSISCLGSHTGKFLWVHWERGLVEHGSSGSGVFRGDTQRLMGVLSFGPSDANCTTHNGSDAFHDVLTGFKYGRFDMAYQDRLYQWLGPQYQPAQMDNQYRVSLPVVKVVTGDTNQYFWAELTPWSLQKQIYRLNGSGSLSMAAESSATYRLYPYDPSQQTLFIPELYMGTDTQHPLAVWLHQITVPGNSDTLFQMDRYSTH